VRDDDQDDLFGKPPAPEKDPIIAAIERREVGISRSEKHAETDAPGWSERAAEHLRRFALTVVDFTIEEARESFEERPAELRSWGSATRKASRRKWIVNTNTTRPTNASNRSPGIVWRAGQ
jgi:hypothetical protein